MRKFFLIINLAALFVFSNAAIACDDTLVMLLTSKNPTSEFSKTIRNFTSSLTELGIALKARSKKDFTPKLERAMNSWMDFTTRYMTNPPEEAKNDLKWTSKTAETSKTIGKIRKLVVSGQISEAHNLVLELSGKIGIFFEAVGISDEKQLFLTTSGNLTVLEQMVLKQDSEKAALAIASLTNCLSEFKQLVPEEASGTVIQVGVRLKSLDEKIKLASGTKDLDTEVLELKSTFNELRSHILMKEWFPETMQSGQERK